MLEEGLDGCRSLGGRIVDVEQNCVLRERSGHHQAGCQAYQKQEELLHSSSSQLLVVLAKLILSAGRWPYLCWNSVELSEMTDRRPNNSKIAESHSVITIAIEGKLVNCVENKT